MPNKQITDEMVEAGAKALGGDDWITCVHDRPMWRREAKEVLEAAARVRAENDAFQDAVVTGLGAVKTNADGTTERVDLRAEPSGKIKEAAQIIQAFIDQEVDYMMRNNLGDPEKQHNVKWGRKWLSALTAGKPEQSGWQPIETAPRDGTDILGWHEIAGTSQTRFSEGEWVCPDWDEDRYIHCTWSPTHWMPLPAAPTAGGREMSAREIIVAAAISHNGLICTMPQPARHHHILHRSGYSSSEEGFLTSEGRFVDRKKAAELAIKVGQIDQLRWPPYLYSEDLW